MPVVKMSSKGQTVIPIEIRKKLGIKPGQQVNLALVDDKAFITPLPQDPIKGLRGILKGKPSMAQALVEERKQQVEGEEEITLNFTSQHGPNFLTIIRNSGTTPSLTRQPSDHDPAPDSHYIQPLVE